MKKSNRVQTFWGGLGLWMASVSAFAATSIDDFSVTSPEQRVQLIELFSSEGCSSCPPADAWLSRYRDHQGLWNEYVPIAFHVTYWDYIGWKDTFGQRKFSRRQYQHLNAKATGQVYTPQLVVNGEEWRGWFRNRHGSAPEKRGEAGVLSLSINKRQLEARFVSVQEVPDDATLHVALLGSGIETKVTRGENRHKTLPHDFVALAHQSYALAVRSGQGGYRWQGEAPVVPETMALARELAWVAWIEGPVSTPLQAVGGWITPADSSSP